MGLAASYLKKGGGSYNKEEEEGRGIGGKGGGGRKLRFVGEIKRSLLLPSLPLPLLTSSLGKGRGEDKQQGVHNRGVGWKEAKKNLCAPI